MKNRFNEEQIIQILHEAESGATVEEILRKHNISRATFYQWKHKFGGLSVSEAKKIRALEKENSQLKKILAEMALETRAIKDVLSKKL